MDTELIKQKLSDNFSQRSVHIPAPSVSEWERLKKYFEAEFPEDFIKFMNIVGHFYFEGDLLSVCTNGDLYAEETIVSAYEQELRIGKWPKNFIPFYDVGNGDAYCLNLQEGKCSKVYYLDHDRLNEPIAVCENFADWIKSIPDY